MTSRGPRLAIVGDFNPDFAPHPRTNEAIAHACGPATGQEPEQQCQGHRYQQAGKRDRETIEQVGNTQYSVVERHFLLIPERAGRVTVPPARFLGRISGGLGGAFGGFLGGDDMRVRGPSAELQVKPIPADAPQPWLPLAGLQLRYVDAPRSARAGETVLVTVQTPELL